MNKRLTGWILILVLALAGSAWALFVTPSSPEQVQATFEGLPCLAGNFTRVTGPVQLEFPRDLGPHPDTQTEWWYYTGNLTSQDGKEFGYQLTFFRRALLAADQIPSRASAWAVSQVYLAHFALTDVAGRNSTRRSGSNAGPRAWQGRTGSLIFRSGCRIGRSCKPAMHISVICPTGWGYP